ncbi:PAS domain S-box protein [Desulfosarcina ovata]|nr:PAS domain S-box protein [Desulfosarcina ovata]
MMNKSITKKIARYEKQYKLIEKAIVDVIFVVDMETMTFFYISPSIEKIIGYGTNEMVRIPINDCVMPHSYRKAMEYLAEGYRKYRLGKNIKRTAQLELIHKDGSRFWVEITAKFFKGETDEIQLFGVMRNISSQRAIEQERNELLQRLEASLGQQKVLQAENEMLRGLLPICSGCKKIRDEDGKWWQVEEYVSMHSEADFSHTICPPCKKRIYPEID